MKLTLRLVLAAAGLLVSMPAGEQASRAPDLLLGQAAALQARGDYYEAEQLLRETLRRLDQVGQAHPQLPVLLNNLASLSQEIGRTSDAERYYQRAIRVLEETQGADHPVLLRPLCNLGSLYIEEGMPGKAERLYRRALRIAALLRVREDDDPAIAWHGLGMALHAQGRQAEAESCYLHAIDLRRSQRLREVELAQTLGNLAVLYLSSGRFADALRTQLLVLQSLEDRLAPGHPGLARPLANLGAIYAKMNRLSEAEEVLLRALAIAQQAFGPDHAVCGGILYNYAQVLRRAKLKAEAKRAEIRAAAIQENTEAGKLGRHTIDIADLAKPDGKK